MRFVVAMTLMTLVLSGGLRSAHAVDGGQERVGGGSGPLSARQERALKPGDVFKECDKCPELVVVPAGSFMMGSPASEKGRDYDEGPQHEVKIAHPFAVGKFHVTVDQFAAFVEATGYDAGSLCWGWNGRRPEIRERWSSKASLNIVTAGGTSTSEGQGQRPEPQMEHAAATRLHPGFAQERSHPVVCVSWKDAKAYVAWLSRNTGKTYRLLTESEFEYAARGGSSSRYPFGDDEAQMCRYGNGPDKTAQATIPGASGWAVFPCSDGYAYTSPSGSFAANGFGLYDMHGNAWSWVEDCYHDRYDRAPADDSAWTSRDCSRRVLRGGSWYLRPRNLRAAYRYRYSGIFRFNYIGFRVARTLD
ncbi:MAG: formylglycine-generating enzyme family protein [Alphaproteobacteria bacterium]|nr:formylglycine-generating enzyme family protein [Alphaproteobacteria bacterium]